MRGSANHGVVGHARPDLGCLDALRVRECLLDFTLSYSAFRMILDQVAAVGLVPDHRPAVHPTQSIYITDAYRDA